MFEMKKVNTVLYILLLICSLTLHPSHAQCANADDRPPIKDSAFR